MRSACFRLKTHIRDGEQGCRGRPRPVGRVVSKLGRSKPASTSLFIGSISLPDVERVTTTERGTIPLSLQCPGPRAAGLHCLGRTTTNHLAAFSGAANNFGWKSGSPNCHKKKE